MSNLGRHESGVMRAIQVTGRGRMSAAGIPVIQSISWCVLLVVVVLNAWRPSTAQSDAPAPNGRGTVCATVDFGTVNKLYEDLVEKEFGVEGFEKLSALNGESEKSRKKTLLIFRHLVFSNFDRAVSRVAEKRGLELVFNVHDPAMPSPDSNLIGLPILTPGYTVYHAPSLNVTDEVCAEFRKTFEREFKRAIGRQEEAK